MRTSASSRLKDSLPRAGCLLLGLIGLGLWTSAVRAAPLTVSGLAFHSMPWQVTVATLPATLTPAQLQSRLQASLDAVNDRLSLWQPDSELARLNAAAVGVCVPVSPALGHELRIALDISARTGGAYDPTVAPLVNLWGFGPDVKADRLPAARDIAVARARVGWRQVELDESAGCVRKLEPRALDLASLGEGAGVDALVASLTDMGLQDFVAGIAGTLSARGRPGADGCWQVALERPDGSGRAERKLALCDDAVVSTSGNYRNYRILGGHRYAHTLDARTGMPVSHDGLSVSVMASDQDATTVDAWTTALNVLGPDAGLSLARKERLAARFLVRTGKGWIARESPAFRLGLSRP